EAARAFRPITSLLEELLSEAMSAGIVRPALGQEAVGVVMQSIMFASFSSTIGGASEATWSEGDAEQLWDLLRNGFGRPGQPR
ncbi:MAG: hypothetical protein ABR549_10230, partial [Mycobacteriales bacterium]